MGGLDAPSGLHGGRGLGQGRRGGSPNANKGAVDRREVGAGRAQNLKCPPEANSLPCLHRSKHSQGSDIKGSGAILEAEQKLGQPGIWGEGWGRAPAGPGEVLPALLDRVPCVRSDSSV